MKTECIRAFISALQPGINGTDGFAELIDASGSGELGPNTFDQCCMTLRAASKIIEVAKLNMDA